MAAERLAPAKVNLFLHVGAIGADGYHPLSSLVTFADAGDVVTLEAADRFGFEADGPFAAGLGSDSDNLVVRARQSLIEGFSPHWSPFRLVLRKNLPVAAGLGGGSADAAAALRLMATRGRLDSSPAGRQRLFDVAARLGADVPMCLVGEPRLALGRGDELRAPPAFPDLEAVLVNALAPSPTGAVYRAYDAAGAPGAADTPRAPAMATTLDVVAFLETTRNDLESPAISLQPAVAAVLATLRALPQTLLARMSGSGATCFALCRDRADRDALAEAIARARPDWWVQPCRLAGSVAASFSGERT
ncbi:MAG TPA: 4-(cytidine 5'-diphospho)-2-C-methyl-D-erythritol kinase [Caulobacteraceae bacterium]|nr:4-(cytidine 5'-diphospho)-2-C-methyl-D-erythritol kinase [Caulobacteraceae bacterium]